MVEKIKVKGMEVGIKGLKDIFETVKVMNIPDEEKKREILNRVKRENYIPASAEKDFEEALWKEFRRFLGEDVPEEESPFMEIKILGPGCPECELLMEETRNALSELGISANCEHVKDLKKIAEYGVVVTPTLVINNKVVSKGKVLKKEQIEKILMEFKK
jgi:small redox-active disulfide protein 2